MQIVTNYADLSTTVSGYTVCHVGFTRKQNDGHHPGHAACISGAKELADKVVVLYWPTNNYMNTLYGDEVTTWSGLSDDFDQTYCTNFCETHGVDVVLVPDSNTVSSLFDGYSISALKSWADGICTTEGYDTFNDSANMAFKSWIIGTKVNFEKDLWFKDYRLYSNKEGLIRFLQKHYTDKYLDFQMNLVDFIRRPDGLPYETTGLSNLTQAEIDLLSQVKGVIDGVGWNVYMDNQDIFIDTVISGINNIGADMALYEFGNSEGGFVGDGNVLVILKVEFIASGHNAHLNEYYEGVVY